MRGAYAQRKDNMKRQPEGGQLWPRRQASGETSPTDTLFVDFSLQNCEETDFCCFSHAVCNILLWFS